MPVADGEDHDLGRLFPVVDDVVESPQRGRPDAGDYLAVEAGVRLDQVKDTTDLGQKPPPSPALLDS